MNDPVRFSNVAGSDLPRGKGRRDRGEQMMVPRAEFRSYYGRQILKSPTWKAHNIAGYFFLGGLAAGSSLLAVIGDLTRRPGLRRAGRLTATVALGASLAALIEDLGRPSRFLNMLRVFRPTSPMNIGTWLLSTYGPLAGVAAFSELAVRKGGERSSPLVRCGRLAGIGAAALAPGVASYTAVILSDTAVPTWHAARRELPFVFTGSAASAASGLALVLVPGDETGPARFLGAVGTAVELAAQARMDDGLGTVGEPLRTGRAGKLMRLAKAFGAGGALIGCLLGRRSRPAAVVGGLAMVAGSACARFGIFYAGVAAAEDPRFTVVPQRERLGRDVERSNG